MSREKIVLITDYAWPSLDPEREIFERAGVRMLVAEIGSEQELLRLAPSANGILCNWKAVSATVLGAAEQCVSVGRYGIGLDNIDVEAATRLGIVVTNVPAYCVDDVADHTMALLLACNRKVCWFDRDIKAGKYDLKAHAPLHRLRGHILGLLGFGRIGRAVSERAQSFGMRVIVLRPRSGSAQQHPAGVEFVSFAELLERSDYLSLHLPAIAETNGLIDAATLRRMKDGAVLINTARGSLVRADDLLDAMETGKIAAAGIDVWQPEPLPANDRLANHPRVVATPHAAFYSNESLRELQSTAATQMLEILSGQMPENIVNPAVLDSQNLRSHIVGSATSRRAEWKKTR